MRCFTLLIGLLPLFMSAAHANSSLQSHWTWTEQTIDAHVSLPADLNDEARSARLAAIRVEQLDRDCPVAQADSTNTKVALTALSFTCFNSQSPIKITDLGITPSVMHHLMITRGLQLPFSQHALSHKYPALRVERSDNGSLSVSQPRMDKFYGSLKLGRDVLFTSFLGLLALASLLLTSRHSDRRTLALFGVGMLLGFSNPSPNQMALPGLELLLGLLIALRASYHVLGRQGLWPLASASATGIIILITLTSGLTSPLDLAFWAGTLLFLVALLFDTPPHTTSLAGLAIFIGTLFGLMFLSALQQDLNTGDIDLYALAGLILATLGGFAVLFIIVKIGHGIFNAFRPARVNFYRDALSSFLVGYGAFVAALGYLAFP
jgi:hypothetical protein